MSAYREVGTYRGAAAMCGTTAKSVRRAVERHDAGGERRRRRARERNYASVAGLVAERVVATKARISAKRLLPAARTAGYEGSARNFRRLVAEAKTRWRRGNHRGRRPAVWTPGEHLVIDWGVEGGLHVFCAVLAWCRVRFVRFAADERAATTFALLAECFDHLGGVPKVVLADRMGCLKGAVVAGRVVPTPDYVRFATAFGFRPDFCEGHDPESKGIVEHLVGYAKTDLIVPQEPFAELGSANDAARTWCAEVNQVVHAEICAVPAERLIREVELLWGRCGNTRLGPELGELLALDAAHGRDAMLAALSRATAFGRWRAADVRSILAAGAAAPQPREPGEALVLELPVVPTRSLADYAVDPPATEPPITDQPADALGGGVS